MAPLPKDNSPPAAENDETPCNADRRPAEMPQVGIQRFAPVNAQHHPHECDESCPAVVQHEMHRMQRIKRRQHLLVAVRAGTPRPGRRAARAGRRPGRPTDDDELTMGSGWTVFSYLISGLLAYGGIGWVIGHFTHISLLFPIGMLVGLAISTGWIVYKYGKATRAGEPPGIDQ